MTRSPEETNLLLLLPIYVISRDVATEVKVISSKAIMKSKTFLYIKYQIMTGQYRHTNLLDIQETHSFLYCFL